MPFAKTFISSLFTIDSLITDFIPLHGTMAWGFKRPMMHRPVSLTGAHQFVETTEIRVAS